MSQEDISNLIDKFSSMINNENLPSNIKDVLNNFNASNLHNSDNSSNSTTDENSSSSFPDIDIETILKIKSILDKMNSKADPASNFLLSLKPFLNDSRKVKVDSYIKFLNLSKVMDAFYSSDDDKKKQIISSDNMLFICLIMLLFDNK